MYSWTIGGQTTLLVQYTQLIVPELSNDLNIERYLYKNKR